MKDYHINILYSERMTALLSTSPTSIPVPHSGRLLPKRLNKQK